MKSALTTRHLRRGSVHFAGRLSTAGVAARLTPALRLCMFGVFLATALPGCSAARHDGPHRQSSTQPSDSSGCVEKLRADLDAIFDQPKFACAYWGVRVERPNGEVLYDRLGDKQFIPASNMKVYTTAAALDLLGPDFTYQTRVEAIGEIKDGTLHGDLLITGSGDPSLGAWHPHKTRDSRQLLPAWVAKIKAAGIHSISGDVIGDGRCFADESYCGGWGYGDLQFWYAAPPSGLAIEENAYRILIRPGAKVGDSAILALTPQTRYITLINEVKTAAAGGPNNGDSVPHNAEGNTRRFVGSVAIDKTIDERGSVWDGTCYTAFLLVEELNRQGIQVKGRAVNIRSLADPERIDKAEQSKRKLLATTTSPALRELAAVVNKISHNFFADQMLLTLSAQKSGKGSFSHGARVVRTWLQDIGVPQPEAFQMYDGSGLARHNTVQPRHTCYVLRHMKNTSKASQAFEASLPISGTDGSLEGRMTEPQAKGKVRAKTGYIGSVRTLSGYATAADGQDLVFSMMCNHYIVPTGEVNAAQDEACRVLIRYSDQPAR